MKGRLFMKFQDYPYVRPNLEDLKKQYDDAIKTLKVADSVEDQITAIKKINKARGTFQTMRDLCYVRATIDTTDSYYEGEQNFFDQNSPIATGYDNELSIALVNSKFKDDLIKSFGKQWFALIEASLKTFKPEIVEDLQEENKLISDHKKLSASAKIEFDGKINNLSQMGPYQVSLDRETRKAAETAVMNFFEENESKYDEIYDKLVKLRTTIAKKLGYDNFIEVGYARLGRTDYDADMVANYRKQVEKDLVPVAKDIIDKKSVRLGIENPKSYDLNIDFKSGNPKPQGDRDYLVNKAQEMYTEMSKETAEFFNFMVEHNLLDLEAKQGKAGGGYCTYFNDYKSPFIFSNFNGTSGDVDVLTHEAGHAFQVYSSRDIEVPEYLFPTLEACEIHSMSMEFFAWPWMELFFGEDAEKYKYHHLSGSITFIPYGVCVDHFQHEVYSNPDMTPDMRKEVWRKLEKRYLPYKVYDNDFLEKGTFWFRQSHIFQVPFYYIDYTLAQVCAQQYWVKNQENHQTAWESYYKLCKVGGSKSFLDLLKVAELNNPFVDGTINEVAVKLQEFLDNFDQSKLV